MSHPFFIIELKADFSLDDCIDFINAMTENGQKIFRNLYIALPFFRLKEMTEKFPDSGITFGSAMLNDADPDSFTEKVASKMVKDAKGSFALIGTRYERERLRLSDVQFENKLKNAKDNGLKPIYCVSGDESDFAHQLEILKTSQSITNDTHPTVIYEISFKDFQGYLPSDEELQKAKNAFKSALDQVFESASEKFAILIALPSDLIGFSSLIEALPFDGAFFIKSGTYPHSLHDETVKLIHVHCEEQD